MSNKKVQNFAADLYKINAIKFGEFVLKSGVTSPIYCDLRVIVSYPKILDTLTQLLIEIINLEDYDVICGVPYTALPIATVISLKTGLPMVMRRKEAKNYGTKKMIEGNFKEGDRCLIIEDIVTSGASILETVADLKNVGLSVTDAVVVLYREQGGEKVLKEKNIEMHSLLTITSLMELLLEAGTIKQSVVDQVTHYLTKAQINSKDIKPVGSNRLKTSYPERANHCSNNITKKLFKVMSDKNSNLCVAADLTSTEKICQLADQIGPYICILKTHVDIIEDFSESFIQRLQQIAATHNFLIMEDRKFADIGKTVALQFTKGFHHISQWADLVTAHSLPGPGLIKALSESRGKGTGFFLIGEMSSSGNLCSEDYCLATIKLARDFPQNVVGIVCQSPKFNDNSALIQLTPGIQLNKADDNLGQQYISPESAILDRGADIGVVGRGITLSSDPSKMAEEYRKLLWNSYLKRIK